MFKKLSITACLFAIAIAVKADDGQKADSKVQKVIVFLNGAQVTRTANVNITAGTSTLVFGNISPNIDVQSLQVRANGDFTILSVKNELNYLNEQTKQRELENLQAQQKLINDKITFQNALLAINKQEQEMLIKNQMITGQNSSLDIVKLKQALDFQTARLTDIKKRENAANELIASLNIELQKYNRQIADITSGSGKATSNILVTVSAKSAVPSTFTLSYLVRDANWFPTYDIRAKNVNSPISIAYKANITQRSGEDWKNIKLTLSTGNPAVNGNKPQLGAYYLDLPNFNLARESELNEIVVVGYGNKKADMLTGRAAGVRGNSQPLVVQQTENQTNVEFNIDNPYSVPSDGKLYTVEINQVEVAATYQYYTAPKVNTNVFLTASLTDWNQYNFLPGEASLFYEGTYIGKSAINTQVATDTLNLSLGVDKSIVVTRISEKELTEKQTFGSNKKETRNWLITVKNRKNQPINLLVEDQVPVSQNSAIEVETQQLSGGAMDKTTGKVSWNLTLNSQVEKKLQLKYQVRYPKNKNILVK